MNKILIITALLFVVFAGVGLYFWFRTKKTGDSLSDDDKKQNANDYLYAYISGALSVIFLLVTGYLGYSGSKKSAKSADEQEATEA
jgi:preprotein translocase subunit SecG